MLRFTLWHSIWLIFVKALLCTFGKNINSSVVGYNILYMSFISTLLIMLFKSTHILIFCLIFLSVIERSVLKSPMIINMPVYFFP